MSTMEGLHPVALLGRLARNYHQVQGEHERSGPLGKRRRDLGGEAGRITERFERLLAHWVHDETLRDAWQRHFYRGGPAPAEPRLQPPPRYRGRTEAGARVEIRAADDGGYDLIVDDAVAEHQQVPWHLDPDQAGASQIGPHRCDEVFDAPDEAVDALRRWLAAPAAEPPWDWARELVEDGLVDTDFGLTPRGERRLRAAPAEHAAARSSFCVLLADAARARVLTLDSPGGELEPTLAPLTEVIDLTSPARRGRDSELLSDTRPGLRREGGHGPRHAVSDHREGKRDDADRHFAELAADEASRIWHRRPFCTVVVVAPPRMLGVLRPLIAQHNSGPSPYDVRELDRDLTRLATPAVHDALAARALLPPRGRRPVPESRRPTPAR